MNEKEKITRKQLHEILDLVLDINGLQESNKEKTGDHPTAFIDFMGHIGKIKVSLCSNGWFADSDCDISLESSIYNDFRFNLPVVIDGLKKFKNRGASDGSY